jgi:hypothetical protein
MIVTAALLMWGPPVRAVAQITVWDESDGALESFQEDLEAYGKASKAFRESFATLKGLVDKPTSSQSEIEKAYCEFVEKTDLAARGMGDMVIAHLAALDTLSEKVPGCILGKLRKEECPGIASSKNKNDMGHWRSLWLQLHSMEKNLGQILDEEPSDDQLKEVVKDTAKRIRIYKAPYRPSPPSPSSPRRNAIEKAEMHAPKAQGKDPLGSFFYSTINAQRMAGVGR